MTTQFLTGSFLIALSELEGGFFENSITLLIEHSTSGAFGVIVNKPTAIDLSALFTADFELPNLELPVLLGGPVEQDHLYFLHSTERQYPQTVSVNSEISLTTSREILDDLSKPCAIEHVLPLLGYAGWRAGQLEFELKQGAWLIAPFAKEIVFSTPYSERTTRAAQQIGIDLNLLINDLNEH